MLKKLPSDSPDQAHGNNNRMDRCNVSSNNKPSWKTKSKSIFSVSPTNDDGPFTDPVNKRRAKEAKSNIDNGKPHLLPPPKSFNQSMTEETAKTETGTSSHRNSPNGSLRLLTEVDSVKRKESVQNQSFTYEDANQYIQESYNLVWNKTPPDCDRALLLLKKAMSIQQELLGTKIHPEIGWTVNFVGATHWKLSQETHQDATASEKCCKSALQYFLEARRIFCKYQSSNNNPNKGPSKTIQSIDARIECILQAQLGWETEQVDVFLSAMQLMMEHEVQGDQSNVNGDTHRATERYRQSRQYGNILKQYISS